MDLTKVNNYGASRTPQGLRPLAQLLPLDTPLSLMVDPTNVCNFKCVFCPTGDAELLERIDRPKGHMRLELFHKVIDDLAAFPRPVSVLNLYKDGEPLAHKSLPEMVAYAKRSDRVTRVETTTNGSLLTPNRSSKLVDAGLDGIRVSVYSLSDSGYRNVTRTPAKFETIRANVASMYSCKSVRRPALHVHCKIVDSGLSDEEKKQFLDTFSPIADSVHIDSIMGWSNTGDHDLTLGLNPARGMLGEPRQERKACSEPFMKLAVNYNGEVSVCCVDWSHATVVGDVNVESLFDIWNGDKLRDFRLRHLTGRRATIAPCSSCDYIRGLPNYSNFDHEIERLLPLYSAAP